MLGEMGAFTQHEYLIMDVQVEKCYVLTLQQWDFIFEV